MSFTATYLTDIGMKRTQNQDSAGIVADRAVFIVADGMGGHQGGEVASQMAVTAISESVTKNANASLPPHELLTEAIRNANQAILKKSKETPQLAGMGTTTTVLHLHDGFAWIGQVGDSRCYLIRKEGIWQLTRDHSLVQEKLRAGMISRDQMRTDKMKNVITRSVGFDPQLAVDVFEYEPENGDVFVMCSDGLSGPVSDPEIFKIVNEVVLKENKTSESVLNTCAQKLIDCANEHGGDDNVTVMMVRYHVK